MNFCLLNAEDCEIKVKLPDHGGNSCTFLRQAPPTRQSGGVPMHGVASVYSYRHNMESWEKFADIRETKTWRYRSDDYHVGYLGTINTSVW